MRHFLLTRAITAHARRVTKTSSAAALIALLGLSLMTAPRSLGAIDMTVALPAVAMGAEEERGPAFTAQTNPQPQNHFAMNRHPPSPAGLDNGNGFVAP